MWLRSGYVKVVTKWLHGHAGQVPGATHATASVPKRQSNGKHTQSPHSQDTHSRHKLRHNMCPVAMVAANNRPHTHT